MKKLLIDLFQWLAIIFSWFTLSPLFYVLARIWKRLSKKATLILMLISPLFLATYILLSIYGYVTYTNYKREHRFAKNKVIERITEVEYPPFKVIEYTKGRTAFQGDYNDELLIEFKEIPSTDFYCRLDSLTQIDNSNWSKRGDSYSFSTQWGNGIPAPKGEDEEEDMTFSISFKKGEMQARIAYGSW